MSNWLATRQLQQEWMDDPNADPELLRRALRFLRRINVMMGFTWTILQYLERFSRRWEKGKTIRLIDLATGSADLPQAVLRWADAKGIDVRVTGIDLHHRTIAEARSAVPDPRLTLVRASALALPFADGQFDYAITSLFLHHLPDDQATQALSEMSRVARRGLIVSDLLRSQRSYRMIWLATRLANRMVRHDAPASVAQSFTRQEITHLSEQAGASFAKYRTHFGHRFVLAGEKE